MEETAMTITRMTDDTFRLQVELDADYCQGLYVALLAARRTERQKAVLKQHASELKEAVPALEPEPVPEKPAKKKAPAAAASKTSDEAREEK